MKGYCCHICNSIQWVDYSENYRGVIMELSVRKKGKIMLVACSKKKCSSEIYDVAKLLATNKKEKTK